MMTTKQEERVLSKLRVAVVGCGNVAQQHVRAWTWFPDEVEIVALVDAVRRKAEDTRAKFKLRGARVLADYRELLDDRSVEAVDLCTYSDLHDDIIAALLEHGKHIMTEKPVGYSLENCRRMRWYGRKYRDLKVGVAYSLRYYPVNVQVKKLVDSGAIGRPVQADITHSHPHDLKDLDGDWVRHVATAGMERATDSGGRYIASSEMLHTTHAFDLARHLLGEVYDVFAFGAPTGTFAMLRFVSGAIAKVSSCTTTTRGIPNVAPVVIQGTEGTIYTSWDYFNSPAKPDYELDLRGYLVSSGKRSVFTGEAETGHGDRTRTRNFIDAVRKGTPLICSMEDGIRTSELLHALWDSVSHETRVPIHRRTQTG